MPRIAPELGISSDEGHSPIRIGSDIRIEWPDPSVIARKGSLFADIVTKGFSRLKVRIPQTEGVRLCVACPGTGGSTAIACRLIVEVAEAAAGDRVVVRPGLAQPGGAAWLEAASEDVAPRLSLRVKGWYDISGALLVRMAQNGPAVELVVALPPATVLNFREIDVIALPAQRSGGGLGAPGAADVRPLRPWRATRIPRDAVDAHVARPAVLSGSAELRGRMIHGHVIGLPQPSQVEIAVAGRTLTVPLAGPALLEDCWVGDAHGFSADLSDLLPDDGAGEVVTCRFGSPDATLIAEVPIGPDQNRLAFRMWRGDDGALTGYAFDRRHPRVKLDLELLDPEGAILAEAVASLQHPAQPCAPDFVPEGHGFRLDPSTLSAKPTLIGLSIRVKGVPGAVFDVATCCLPVLEGAIDEISEKRVSGWAAPPSAAGGPARVSLWLRGRRLGAAVAEEFRESLTVVYRSNGFCGFSLPLPGPLEPGDVDRLLVVVDPGLGRLTAAPEVLQNARRLADAARTAGADAPGPLGRADAVGPTSVTGWALDRRDPGTPVRVGLFLDGQLVASVLADAPRADVGTRFGTSGRHGFGIELPPGLDLDAEVPLQLRILGSETPLSNVPRVFRRSRKGLVHPRPKDLPSAAYPAVFDLRAVPGEARLRSVGIVVLNRNGADHLEGLFRSFAAANRHPDYRFLVIDHGSTDASLDVCARWSDRLAIDVLARGVNASFSESNNLGASRCRADVLLFLNNDILLTEDVLSPILRILEDDRVGAVGVRLASPCDDAREGTPSAGFVQHLGIRFGHKPDRPLIAAYEQPQTAALAAEVGKPWRVPAATAALLAMRRGDFETLGGFDERYFYGYEDVDLCLNIRRTLGKEIVCATGVTALHVRGATRSSQSHESRQIFAANQALLSARFGAEVRQALRRDILAGGRFWRAEPLRVAFAVSTIDMAAPEADFFTAYELGEALVRTFGWQVTYLPPEAWYDLADVDVLVAMRHDWSPRKVSASNANLVLVAWARNWFSAWLDAPWIESFDAIWAASAKARDAFAGRTGVPVTVVRIATNPERFGGAAPSDDLRSDYCFTGSFFKAPRDVISCLDPEALPYRFALFGHNWSQVRWLAPYWKGPLPYDAMPSVYASTRIVIDDCNQTVKPWGSVNSRVFDAIAAGALVVTNGLQGSFEAFDGLLPVYQTRDELRALLERYLGDEPARLALVARLRRRVEAEHTYRHRAATVRASLLGAFEGLRYRVRDAAPAKAPRSPVSGMVAAGLRAAGCFVRAAGDMPAARGVEQLGDDVVVFVTSGELSREVDGRQDQVALLVHLGTADDISLAAARRFDALLVRTPDDAERLEPAGRPVRAIFPDAAAAERVLRTLSDGDTVLTDAQTLQRCLAEQLRWLTTVAEACNRTKFDTVPHRLIDATAVHELRPPSVKVLFWPDYTLNNPYQRLMYEAAPSWVSVAPGTLRSALKSLEGAGTAVVFHLHWTAPILGRDTTAEEAAERMRAFIGELEAFKRGGGRLVWTVHNTLSHECRHPELEAALCATIAEQADLVHVHGGRVPELVQPHYRLPGERTVVARHGSYIGRYPQTIDRATARRRLGLAEADRVFVHFGQLRGYKGVEDLLDAFAAVRSARPDCHLVIAGKPGAEETAVLDRAAAMPGVTIALGEIPDDEVQTYLTAADVVVLPFTRVLTSGSLYLALSFGRPVIAPRLGLVPDVVRDGIEGLLYDPERKDGLQRALERACQLDPDEMASLGIRARERAVACDWTEIAALVSRFIPALVHGRARMIDVFGAKRLCVVSEGRKKPERRRVAAVVLHYSHLEDTVRCVRSLLAQRFGDLHVYIVSNAETAEAFGTLARAFPDCTVVQSPDNLGYAGGNNIGLALALGDDFELCWIVNPDTVAPEDFLERMMAIVDVNPGVALFGPKILFGDRPDRVWFAGGLVAWDEGLETTHRFIGKRSDEVPDVPIPCDYITGASLLFRSDVIRRIGPIPEDYFLYFEETHWCLNAAQAGFGIVTYPSVNLHHHKRSEEGGAPTAVYLYYFIRNALVLCRRLRPDRLDATERGLRRKAEAWLEQVRVATPERLEEARRVIAQGFADGCAGVTGRVPLGAMRPDPVASRAVAAGA